ncbi:MAG: UDP-glucose 4-epimerase [Acidimicrobiaceae bacterium]
MRVLVTGMGAEIGTRVTNLLEADERVDDILGVDIDPPRRRLHRAEFRRVDPRDRRKLVKIVRDFDPTAVVHLGVYEPNARCGPALARELTHHMTVTALGAAAESESLDRIVVRSGIEVYGRGRGAATRPDESIAPAPTSPFGRSMLEVENAAREIGLVASAAVTAVRCAPIVGPHMASPLGRLLRLPIVPVGALSDLPFSLLHERDAALAFARALECGFDGPVNVVAPGAVTPMQAARIGGRGILPALGPSWLAARLLTELLGAPLPAHVRELLVRGRTADGSLAEKAIGVKPEITTPDVIKDLFEWATVTYLRPTSEEAA